MEYLKRVGCEATIKLDEIIVISVSEYENFKEELEALLDKYRL